MNIYWERGLVFCDNSCGESYMKQKSCVFCYQLTLFTNTKAVFCWSVCCVFEKLSCLPSEGKVSITTLKNWDNLAENEMH